MNLNLIYTFGIIFLFFGLFWSFLPHIYHEKIGLSELNINDENKLENEENELEEENHLIHIIIGLPPTILGIILIEYYNRKNKIRLSRN